MHFKKLTGRKSIALRDMFDEIVIIELKDGKIYGGLADEYFYDRGGVLSLFDPKLLDKKSHTWVDHDIMLDTEGEVRRDVLPDFWISDIRDVLVLSDEMRDKCSVEDALQLYVNPHYKPLPIRVKCPWDGNGKDHSSDCDARLHEALAFLLNQAQSRGPQKEENAEQWNRKLHESFTRIRRRLLTSGAKIP